MTKKWCLVVSLTLLSLMSAFVKAEGDVLPLSPADLREMTLESIPPWPGGNGAVRHEPALAEGVA